MTMADRQRDNFAYDRLPPRELWPELIFDLPELRYPERLNCAVALLDDMIAAGAGARACFIGDDAVWTYAEVAERVGRLANVLKARGMTPGSRVLLRGPNNPMMMVCWLAVERIGAIAVATMPLLRARELAVVMEQAQIDLALCDHRLTEELERAAGMAKSEAAILVFGDAQGALEGAMREASPACPPVDTAADDIALIAFTSGSTGKPKGCIHFHRDVLAIADTFSKHVLKPVADDIF
ncbi:AMP-binding protein, partial [Parvibaculum sp.]|uniref:AMP-binding protein n=1 Tax=Parvibaculum sp. TaxID=2024848 RepID=UPI002B5F5DCD